MPGEHKKKEETIYYAALKFQSEEERNAYLKRVCGGDKELLARVSALLEAREVKDSFLEPPSLDAEATLDTASSMEIVGTIIGRYKIMEKIGEGGMASVYVAEQEQPFRRKVALKIIKLGMDTKQVIARFEAERQSLAMMDHPNIAKVFDAGTTETGRPYFVMELVKGISITEYCDRNNLNTQERLELFIPICQAIQHAHQKGIIHRDIKPSNVLVTSHDGKPVPKVIDFGIAKATNQRLTEKTLYTHFAQIIGTVEYMSPEQAEMSGLDIDTRTDIYALGVLLYELLTGTTPFEGEMLRSKGYAEMQRIIREEEPIKPSTKLSTLGEALSDLAEHRRSKPELLPKLVRGDLDWIVMKTLEKDRTRRYETAKDLASDIQSHLNYEPITAGAPGVIYRLQKYVRRRRRAVLATLTVVIAVVGIVFGLTMYYKAQQERDQSELIRHKQVLAEAKGLFQRGQYEDALSMLEPIEQSKHMSREVQLIKAQSILHVGGPAEAVPIFEGLTNKSDDIAGEAHFLLAKLFYESDPASSEETEGFRIKWEFHRKKAEELLSGTVQYNFLKSMATSNIPNRLNLLSQTLELDKSHFEALQEKAYIHFLNRNYQKTVEVCSRMIGIQPENPVGYFISAIALRELNRFDEALQDHTTSIKLSPDESGYYDQRRETYMRMENYQQAVADAQKCVNMPSDSSGESFRHLFNLFSALIASGRYIEAENEYIKIINHNMCKWRLNWFTLKYIFNVLEEHRSWYPIRSKPKGAAFWRMYEAEGYYSEYSKIGKRVTNDAYHPNWSPDGNKIVYSRGIHGISGVEVLDLEKNATQLLTAPGHDGIWSPNGNHIAFCRKRPILPLSYLAFKRGREKWFQNEIYLIKTKSVDEPRKLNQGVWPSWSSDSRHVYSLGNGLNFSKISIEGNRADPKPIASLTGGAPAISPDEKYVAFASGQFMRIIDISTGRVATEWLAPPGVQGLFASWSPDGKMLSISGYKWPSLDFGLWIYQVETHEAKQILSGPIHCTSWSPDGRLAFVPSGTKEIWVTDKIIKPTGNTPEEHCQELIETCTRRIDNESQIADNLLLRAEAFLFLGKHEKCLFDLGMYVECLKNPSSAAIGYDLIAWKYSSAPQKRIDPNIILQLAIKAHELDDKNNTIITTLGAAYYRSGNWQKTIDILEEKLRQSSGKPEDFLILAMANHHIGDRDEARKWYSKVLEWLQANPNGIWIGGVPFRQLKCEAAMLLRIDSNYNGF